MDGCATLKLGEINKKKQDFKKKKPNNQYVHGYIIIVHLNDEYICPNAGS